MHKKHFTHEIEINSKKTIHNATEKDIIRHPHDQSLIITRVERKTSGGRAYAKYYRLNLRTKSLCADKKDFQCLSLDNDGSLCRFYGRGTLSSFDAHKCRFNPSSTQTISALIEAGHRRTIEEAQNHERDSQLSQVEQSVLVFFARSGTPFRTVEDNGFVKMEESLIKLGQRFPNKPTSELLPQTSRFSLSRNMVRLSEQLRKTTCDITFTVSMCVDGVTPPAGHEHTHVFVLADPSQQSFPRFHSIREISASGIDSATAILDEVTNLNETGVRIHCFVSDGGSGYCWAHKLNTALRHLHSRSVLLRASLELLSTFSETVPTSKTDVPNPPKFIGSRWISCGPIVQWFRANRQSLSTMMALSVSELHFMDLLHDLINPLFNTVGILERNTMSIANSPPLLTNLVYLLCSLAQSVHSVSFQWANLINDLATEVCRLTLLDDDGSAAILGYSLTSCGREMYQGSTFLTCVDGLISEWHRPSQPEHWDEAFINRLRTKLQRITKNREESEVEMESEEDDEDTVAIHSIEQARQRKRETWRTCLDERSSKRRSDDDEIILLVQPGDSVSKGVEVAVEIDEVVRFTRPLASSFIPQLTQTSSMVANLEILLETTFPKMMKTDIDRNLSAYEVWLDGGVVPNQHRLMRSSLDFWKKEVETEDSEFYHLAFLADTLLRTPPTQAAAERTIKVVKRHASLKRPRLASKTNDAILRVASLSESTLSLPPVVKTKRDEDPMQKDWRVNCDSDTKSIRTDGRSLDEIRFDARYGRSWKRAESVTNGSCFYHSILLLLRDVDISISDLRRQTVEYMNQNRESIDVDTFLHDWENRMSENLLQTTPVEMWEIVAVSHLLQRQIIIHSSCMRPIATMLQPSQVVRQQPALRVAYVNGNHYQPMIPVAK
ncbi:hypothetical protein BLNAU_24338 [Blattamonas nauphoetae]|uniref:OTU domain-containing protein n=1 Tax=Blattamonas nauphoetae TaxID=2049346 RepID=A0ABQ9WPS1_9EUKA|nr:hypothetical protein BLNAU_24338 [Blattamonas nauphoetae]